MNTFITESLTVIVDDGLGLCKPASKLSWGWVVWKGKGKESLQRCPSDLNSALIAAFSATFIAAIFRHVERWMSKDSPVHVALNAAQVMVPWLPATSAVLC